MEEAHLLEAQIREALRVFAGRASEDVPQRIVEEFWVPSIHVRADMVSVGDELHAYEIKSHADSLRRLPGQAAGFGAIFDRCSIVVAPRHLDRATDIVPEWWGVIVAEPEPGRLVSVRAPAANPSVEIDVVVRLLWRDEVIAALEANDIEPDLVGGRAGMWTQLVRSVDAHVVRDAARSALVSRTDWRGDAGRFSGTPAPSV